MKQFFECHSIFAALSKSLIDDDDDISNLFTIYCLFHGISTYLAQNSPNETNKTIFMLLSEKRS